MLRALLERRFRLKAHIETEQMPAVALTVAAGRPQNQTGPGQRLRVSPHATSTRTSRRSSSSAARPRCGAANGPTAAFTFGAWGPTSGSWRARGRCRTSSFSSRRRLAVAAVVPSWTERETPRSSISFWSSRSTTTRRDYRWSTRRGRSECRRPSCPDTVDGARRTAWTEARVGGCAARVPRDRRRGKTLRKLTAPHL